MKPRDDRFPGSATATLEPPAEEANVRHSRLDPEVEVGGFLGASDDAEVAERIARLSGFLEGFEEGITTAMELARESRGDTDWIQY